MAVHAQDLAATELGCTPVDAAAARTSGTVSELPRSIHSQPVAGEAELVAAHLPLVGHIVREMLTRLPAHIDRSDLISAGSLALLQAARCWDAARGVPFSRYAALRIRGALLDELRSRDWASRSVRGRAREIDTVRGQLAARLGRAPTSAEVAAASGISVSDLQASQADVTRAAVLSLQGFDSAREGAETLPERSQGPEGLLVRREELGVLHDGIAELPERLRFVVSEYFFQDRQMSDIAAELGVSESRVSQLRAEAVTLLREGMMAHRNPDQDVATTAGPRVTAQRQAYVAAVASRSSLAARLAHSSLLGEPLRVYQEFAATA